ncbi:hypothetical protein FA15DRAFT_706874 [Coprinopsis marcescibilis]|uniref:Uncharacterized protein n=1 Tax=Coprinopsis marcescibilis TaxID=230819 RepID=A0A5C3KN70_COPMA|nr:hypothetical protein FA15DRAFT_706874 [Coprinopsis marcescibilis]
MTPLEDFFSEYDDFDYQPRRSATSEFHRLCRHKQWGRYDADRDEAHENFKSALVREFNLNYGTEASLEGWQALCERLGVDPIPTTLKAAREAVKATHVNLVDLTQGADGRDVVIFPTEVALSNYTKETGRFFPRDHLEAGDLLRNLLRRIMNPRSEGEYNRTELNGSYRRPKKRNAVIN